MTEQRDRMPPTPDDYHSYINLDQRHTLNRLRGYGWELEFIRRPLFQEAVVVIKSPDGKQFGTLENTGQINLNPEINLRTAC